MESMSLAMTVNGSNSRTMTMTIFNHLIFLIKASSLLVNWFQIINQAFIGLKTILNKQRHFQKSFLFIFYRVRM
jgi:hypothetical protein